MNNRPYRPIKRGGLVAAGDGCPWCGEKCRPGAFVGTCQAAPWFKIEGISSEFIERVINATIYLRSRRQRNL